jgi:hypothetical protein
VPTTTSSSSFAFAIDWAELPAEVRETLSELGADLADGESIRNFARRLGCAPAVVTQRIGAARAAIVEQLFDRVDDLDPATRERLFGEVEALTAPR